ncbi:STAS domain-containing protein [Rhizocola hellebori]|uniref:STAS domain-containing protein n=1 Tax=Rhizocola hellebori TaxID=1392758 RepID=UPI0019457E19|nr:STAS domain-containing protein [Rhizocola hellebori]
MTTEVIWLLGPPLRRGDIPQLCDQLGMLITYTGALVVICDVGDFAEPDMVVVDALARLQFTARRNGAQIHLARASPRLRGLLALAGLGGTVPLAGDLRRETEEREDSVGVEEVVDPGDLSV